MTVVEAADGEPHWAINIKKGIINLWQVNLGQRGLISPSGLDSHLDSAFMGRDSPAMNVFKVMEVCLDSLMIESIIYLLLAS